MTRGKIAVIGASGFVGGVFVEHVERVEGAEVVPFIHSTGNAAGLARRGRELRMVDLLSPASVEAALRDCTHVVNCARGNREVLGRGLQNLLDASLRKGIERLVHVSSVAVYGNTPPGALSESRHPQPDKGTYGAHKLAQDVAVEAAVKRGLPAVVICPPNISGPRSPFLLDIVNTLRARQFGLVEEGALPCELVDVENLAHAMTLALDPAVKANGERIFVTDESEARWKDVVGYLTLPAEQAPSVLMGREEATRVSEPPPAPVLSARKTLRHLMSSGVRDALRKDPLIARMEVLAISAIRATPARLQTSLRKASGGEKRRRPPAKGPASSIALLRQQLRDVRYSTTRAHDVLKYKPVLSFDQSMTRFVDWYREAFGWDTEWWPLLKRLHA
jgi:nucleoside-diphosphate-sugar epimerase